MYLKKYGVLFKYQFLSICCDAVRSSIRDEVGNYYQPTTAAIVVATLHVNLRRQPTSLNPPSVISTLPP